MKFLNISSFKMCYTVIFKCKNVILYSLKIYATRVKLCFNIQPPTNTNKNVDFPEKLVFTWTLIINSINDTAGEPTRC